MYVLADKYAQVPLTARNWSPCISLKCRIWSGNTGFAQELAARDTSDTGSPAFASPPRHLPLSMQSFMVAYH